MQVRRCSLMVLTASTRLPDNIGSARTRGCPQRPPPSPVPIDEDSEDEVVTQTPPKKRQRLHTQKKAPASSRPLRQLAAYVASLGGDSDVITKTWAAREARGGGGAGAYRAPDGATYRSRARPLLEVWV